MNYGEVLAKVFNRELVIYKSFGSYQGDFIAITRDSNKYYIYKGCYGSCSGCDSLESFISNNCNYDSSSFTLDLMKTFVGEEDYTPFIEVDKEVFERLLNERDLKSILPANTRLNFDNDDYEDMTDAEVMKEIEDEILTLDVGELDET